MAEAEDERWGDQVDEAAENIVLNSEILMNMRADDQSSTATSYSASVTNSPAGIHPESISDDAQE